MLASALKRDHMFVFNVILLFLVTIQAITTNNEKTQSKTRNRRALPPDNLSSNKSIVYCEIIAGDDGPHLKSAEHRLIDFLFGTRQDPKYNPGVRPKRNSRQSVDVTIQMSLLSINSLGVFFATAKPYSYLGQILDDKNQELSTTGYMMMEWADQFLVWDPKDFDNLTNVVVQPELIWLPSDIGIENSVDAVYQSSFRTEFRAIVDYEGKVTWTPGGRISTSCKLDVTFYPYDSQACIISLSSWAYSDKHVHLTTSADRVDLKDYNTNGEWHLIETKARSGVRFYGEPYSYVMFEIAIQRKFYYHLINILIPCTLMSGLIPLVFKLPAESGEKTGLGITILLSFSVFLLMIAESLPKTSDSLPIIGFYLTFLLVCSSSSLLLTIIVLNMHHAVGDKIVPPTVRSILKILSIVTFTRAPRFSHSGRRSAPVLQKLVLHVPRTDDESFFGVGQAGYVGKLSNNGSPYFMNYAATPPPPAANHLSRPRRSLIHDAMLAAQIKSTFQPDHNGFAGGCDNSDTEDGKTREALSAYVEQLHSKMKRVEIEDEIRKDWKECSLCVDRIAFRIFSLLIGFVSLTMCVGLPMVRELNVNNHW